MSLDCVNNIKLFALHDYDQNLKSKFGAFETNLEQSYKLNKKGYGIHFVPNEYTGKRCIKNVSKIRFWYADIDEGNKPDQMLRIDRLIIKPTIVVESKRGYHIYWKSKDGTIKNFGTICMGIIEKLRADKAIKDPCRLFRMPGFNHMKDKNNPFMVRVIINTSEEYSEKEMLYAYQISKKLKKTPINYTLSDEEMLSPKNWEKIFKISRIVQGNRNDSFAKIVLWLKSKGFDSISIRQTVLGMNQSIYQPLSEIELNRIFKGKI